MKQSTSEINKRYWKTKNAKLVRKKYRSSPEGKAAQRRYLSSHKGREANKRYQRSLKGKVSKKAAQKRFNNTEKGRASMRRKQQSEKRPATRKRYNQSLKGKAAGRRYAAERRERKQALRSKSDKVLIAEIYAKCAELKEYGFDVVVDHTIPLASGGLHVPSNLQIIYAEENRKKGNRADYKPSIVFGIKQLLPRFRQVGKSGPFGLL
jgi:hypothetical protein